MALILDNNGLRKQAEMMLPVGSVVTVHRTDGQADGIVLALYPYGFLCSMHGGRYNEFFRYNSLFGKENNIRIVAKKAKKTKKENRP